MNGKRILAVAGLLLLAGPGCMDEGFDGNIEPVNIFVDERGCVTEEPQTFSFFIDFDVDQLHGTLDVYQGAADLILGVGEAPFNYTSVGRGPGTQKLRVGPGSNVPVQAGTWQVSVAGATGVTTQCDPENPPDWRLVVSRTGTPGGTVILSQSCDSLDFSVPACLATPCVNALEIPLVIPEDAGTLEVVLNSLRGDADLFFLSDTGVQLGASTNPGTGYDIIRLGSDVVVPLRTLTATLRLQSWSQATEEYNLQVRYSPGS